MEIGGTFRVQLGFLSLLLLGIGLLLSDTGHAACTSQDQNSGEHCTAVPSTPWSWTDSSGYITGSYPSLESLIEAIRAKSMSVPSPRRCSVTLDAISYDVQLPGYAFQNVPTSDTQRRHHLAFTVVRDNITPCQVTEYLAMTVLGQRSFLCPAGQTRVFQDSPRVGPHCALEWWKVDERKSAGCGDCKTGQIDKGNPIQVGTGNKYQRETDYVSAGHHPLRIDRHYNSNLIKNYQPSQFEPEPFGPGWSAGYFQRIKYFALEGRALAYTYRPDGQVLTFNLAGSNFIGPPDTNERLSAERNGAGNIVGWMLTTRTDDTEYYDANGKLLSIRYRDGGVHLLEYETSGLLKFITDDGGLRLQILFDAKQRVSKVFDPAGLSIVYSYATNNTLTGVAFQDTTTKQYHYSGYYLTGVTDEGGVRYSTFTYNAYWGNAQSTEHAGGVEKYVVSGTTVTDPLGRQRTYGISSTTLLHVPPGDQFERILPWVWGIQDACLRRKCKRQYPTRLQ